MDLHGPTPSRWEEPVRVAAASDDHLDRHLNRGTAAPIAAELMQGIPGFNPWYQSIIAQFAAELDAAGAFAGLSTADARAVATAIATDLTDEGHPRHRLQRRARNIIRRATRYDNSGRWDDPQGVYRAVMIAANLARSRAFGLNDPQ